MDARKFRAGGCRLIWLLASASAAGCHLPGPLRFGDEALDGPAQPEERPTATAAPTVAAPAELPKALADEHWVQAGALAVRTPGSSGYFWQHHALETWLAATGDPRPALQAGLASASPIVAANAAILLARAGDAAGVERLATTVGNVELSLPLRCAAVEALGGAR